MLCRLAPLLLAAAFGGGCGDEGSVELAWVFVDRDGESIYPGGAFSIDVVGSTCGLPGVLPTMRPDQGVPYDMRVELELCDPECAAGCDDEECLVVPRRRFACNSARGHLPTVPASDIPYRFTVRTVLSSPELDLECRDPAPSCIATPSPRERLIEPGLVTDLQVYQLVVDIDLGGDRSLDLEACGCA